MIMKKLLIVIAVLASVLVCVSCDKSKGKTKNKKTSVVLINGEKCSFDNGHLEELIIDKTVESLEWQSGSICGADIDAMRKYCKGTLKVLDMEKASFLKNIGSYSTDVSYNAQAFVSESDCVPFAMCYKFSALETVILPSKCQTIDNFGFADCPKLKEVKLPGKLKQINDYAFMATGLETITLPDGLTGIGREAFYETPLKEITIPASVKTFYDDTFIFYNRESKLQKVTCLGKNPPAVNTGATNKSGNIFGIVPAGFKIYVPAGSVDSYKSAYRWSTHADQIVSN